MRTLDDVIHDEVARDSTFSHELQLAQAELSLAMQIAHARETAGLTQTALAGRAGMAQSAVARYEKAGRTPTVETLWRLASALNATFVIGPDFSSCVRLIPHSAGSASIESLGPAGIAELS